MIVINFNKPEFEYDVYSLMKAFFQKEEVEMYYTCPEEEVEGKNVACTHRELDAEDEETKKRIEEAEHVFYVDYVDVVEGEDNINGPDGTQSRIIIRWIEKGRPNAHISESVVDSSNRIQTKNILKKSLYNLLKDGLKEELPWGTLTGIRPTKIPMKLMEEGHSDEEIFSYMKENYFATDEKIQLSIDIAKREKALLSKIDYENGYSLYIGIPFCPSTCLYCSFTSYPLAVWSKKVDEYLDALEKEIDFTAQKFYLKKLNSIYIGGGTPTTLNPQQLDRLIRKIKCSFDLQHCVEFTVEAGRPDSITREKLAVLRKHNIDRISINPQTM